MIFKFFILFILSESLAQIVNDGPCPLSSVSPALSFDIEKISGTWYQWARVDNLYEYGQRCGKYVWTANNDGTISQHYTAITGPTGAEVIWNIILTQIEGAPAGIFNITYPNNGEINNGVAAFVDANWDYWAIFRLCELGNAQNLQYFSIVTRSPDLSEEHAIEVYKAWQEHNIPLEQLIYIKQHGCKN